MTTISPTLAPCATERSATAKSIQAPCLVVDSPIGASLVATRAIAAGETILVIDGRLQREPTRYSIQLDVGTHIEAERELPDAEMRVRHPWRFLNHCCAPNAYVRGRALVAREPIAAGAQITFDYTTTEASMAEPFDCRCGASDCLGAVRGFIHLSPEEQRARGPWLAPHLRGAPVR